MKSLYILSRKFLAEITESVPVWADNEAEALAQASELDRLNAILRSFIEKEPPGPTVAEKVPND